MRITYIANIRFPTERAHGTQIAKSCEAFAAAGADVELIVPDRSTEIEMGPDAYYRLRRVFPIRRVQVPDIVHWGALGFLVESLVFALRARAYAAKGGVIYCRDEWVLAALWLLGVRNIVWESHVGSWNIAARLLSRKAAALVVITRGLMDWYVERGVAEEKIVVAPDGIDLEDFAHPSSKPDARARLGLPVDAPIAMYIGSLGGWKGVETLYAAGALLPEHVLIAVIGGSNKDASQLSALYPRVRFLGPRPYSELADNQAAADILVLPNTGTHKVSARFTSPLKLFTYMAAGVPIVASDLPSIREVLDPESAFLVPADDAKALASGIMQALNNKDDGLRRAARAKALLAQYTWDKRAQSILAFMKGRT